MRLDLQIDNQVSPAIRQFVRSRLSDLRRQALDAAARQTLSDTIRHNPVETARSRAAWVTALEQLGGVPPTGWQGPTPTHAAEGRSLGGLNRRDEPDVTEISASNSVRYVLFLEYGSSRMAPVAMLRRALARTRHTLLKHLRSLFR